jgi:hypothetical protein
MLNHSKIITCLGAAMISFFVGCASHPVVTSPVGPEPIERSALNANGYLQVFSETEDHVAGDGPPYRLHTGYAILDRSGKQVKYVQNHVGEMDEMPTLVDIPAGSYRVVAQSASYGRVTVPVVIREGKATLVHLDREGKVPLTVPESDVVRLPDGEIVGWSGSGAPAFTKSKPE